MTNALYEKLSNKYGTCTYEGEEYVLTQNAYIDGPVDDPYYLGMAIKASDTPDEDGFLPAYQITWFPRAEWLADPDLQEDEGDACDWDSPYSVEHVGGYDPENDRNC